MKAPRTSPTQANLNQLRRGRAYRARTARRTIRGEYLGIESIYGDFAILLRHAQGTESIPIGDLVSIQQAA